MEGALLEGNINPAADEAWASRAACTVWVTSATITGDKVVTGPEDATLLSEVTTLPTRDGWDKAGSMCSDPGSEGSPLEAVIDDS